MKSFSEFVNGTLLEFAGSSSFVMTPQKEKYIAGGDIKSKELVPLMSLKDFYFLEMHHGRLKPEPNKSTLINEQIISEVYDKDIKALAFDPSTNYNGLFTFINDIITKLKNIQIHGTNEGGEVDEKALKYVLDHINHIIKNENGLKGHLESFNKLSERTFIPVRSDKKYSPFSSKLTSKLSYVIDKGIPKELIYDEKNNVMREDNIKLLIKTFEQAYDIVSKTFDSATKKGLLHKGFLYDESGLVDQEELKKYLKGEKNIEPALLSAFKKRSSKPLKRTDIEKIYVNFVKAFAKNLKKVFKIQYNFENMATMTSLSANEIRLIFGENTTKEEVKAIQNKFKNTMEETLNDIFNKKYQDLELYMYTNKNKKFKKVDIEDFSKVVSSIHRNLFAQKDENSVKELFKVSAVNTSLGKNVKVSNTQKKMDSLDSNKKLSTTEGTVMDFTLPAYRGLVLMERPWTDIYGKEHPKNSLAVINTCPAAGVCKNFCYATKGGYIMFTNPQLQAAKMLTKLVNRPQKFKQEMISAIKEASTNKKLTLRWHDAGDFFTTGYFELVMDIAEKTPDVLHYAYTKRADLLKQSISGKIASVPENFVFNISKGSVYDKSISKELIKNRMKFSDVVPTKFKKSQLTPEILSELKNKKNIVIGQEDVVFKFPSKDVLKELTGDKDEVYKDLHDGYIMALKHVYEFEIPIKTYNQMTKIKEGSQGKFNVLVYGDDGDAGAFRKDVVGSLLVIH